MPPCFCSSNPPSPSISSFISAHPHLSMLETHCQTLQDLKKIHAHLIKTGLIRHPLAASRVLAFCATSPAAVVVGYAFEVFRHMHRPNLFAWNTIIRAFSRSARPDVALHLFVEMLVTASVQPDRLTYPSLFKAYSDLGLPKNGAELLARVIKLGLHFDPFVRNSIIHMYANCGLLHDAEKLFNENDADLDVVAWNSMVMGLAKCGEIGESWRLFSNMPCRNKVSWNTMISGFVRNGKWEEALQLFHEMQTEEIRPTEFTLVSTLNACAKLGALEQGKWIHHYINKNYINIDSNVIVMTAILDMYCKCGDVESARQVFETTSCKGLSCWNSMMLGLATNGHEDEVFQMFLELSSSNVRPDSVTFIALLTASNHSGQVDKAREYFQLMTDAYGIDPTIQHYGCMVDVLGRAGLIKEAEEFVRCMPIQPDAVVWGSLLSACRSHGNIDVAELAMQNLILLDPDETSAHVLMSEAYASLGELKKATRERVKMKTKGMEKQPGCSSIEVNGEVHEFVSGGLWHSQTQGWEREILHKTPGTVT